MWGALRLNWVGGKYSPKVLQKSSQNEASGLHFGSQNGAKIARAKGESDQNSAPKCSKRAPKMKPRGSILAPKMVPKWLLEASAALLGANWALGACLPGGLRERFGNLPGRLLEPTWRPRGPRRPPGAILAPFLEPKWSPEASFFKLFWTPWGSILVTCALCSLRPRVYVAAGCLLGDVSLLFLSALCSPLAAKVVPKMEPRDLIFSILGIIPVAVISTVLARRNARSD